MKPVTPKHTGSAPLKSPAPPATSAATDTTGTKSSPRQRKPQSLEALTLLDALLKIQTVVTATGLSNSTIFRKTAAGEFPAPVRLGARCTRWRAADVRAWLATRVVG